MKYERCMNMAHEICIVDDDDAVLRSLSRLLDSAGYRTRGFSTGRDLLSSQSLEDVLVISDILMPEMNGFDLFHELKTIDPSVPVIMLSGHADERIKKKAMEMGVRAILDKPVDSELLLSTIQDIVKS